MPTFLGRRVPTSAIVGQAPRPYTAAPAPSMRTAQAAPMGDLSKAIAGLGANFANGTQRALQQEQLTKLQDGNELTRMVANSIGADGIIADPRNASIAAALGAMDPTKYGRLQAIQAATTGGVDSPKAAEFLTGLGEYKNTPLYGERDFANKVAMQDMQEATKLRMVDAQEAANTRRADMALETVMTPEGPRMVRRSAAVGQTPILSKDQTQAGVLGGLLPDLSVDERKVVAGVSPMPSANPTPKTYVADGKSFITYDGVKDAQTGAQLPGGGAIVNAQGPAKDVGIAPAVKADQQKAELDRTRFKGMLDYTRNIASKDATLFGIPGQARRLGQEGIELANGLAQTFGASNVGEARRKIFQEATASGVNPKILSELFDPNLPAIVSAANLLTYQAASALAGQQGRSVTDKDILVFRKIAGDPTSLFESQASYLAKLQTMEDMLDVMTGADANTTQRLGGTPIPARPGTTPPPAGGGTSSLKQKYGLE